MVVGTFDKVLGTGPFENTTQKERLEEIQRYDDERNRKPVGIGIAQAGETISVEDEYTFTVPKGMTARKAFSEDFGYPVWEVHRPGDLSSFVTSMSISQDTILTESMYKLMVNIVFSASGANLLNVGCNEFFNFENAEFCYVAFSGDFPTYTAYGYEITVTKGEAPPLQIFFSKIGQWESDDMADIKAVVDALQEA